MNSNPIAESQHQPSRPRKLAYPRPSSSQLLRLMDLEASSESIDAPLSNSSKSLSNHHSDPAPGPSTSAQIETFKSQSGIQTTLAELHRLLSAANGHPIERLLRSHLLSLKQLEECGRGTIDIAHTASGAGCIIIVLLSFLVSDFFQRALVVVLALGNVAVFVKLPMKKEIIMTMSFQILMALPINSENHWGRFLEICLFAETLALVSLHQSTVWQWLQTLVAVFLCDLSSQYSEFKVYDLQHPICKCLGLMLAGILATIISHVVGVKIQKYCEILVKDVQTHPDFGIVNQAALSLVSHSNQGD